MIKYAAFFVSLFALTSAYNFEFFAVKLQWNYLNYTWPTAETYLWAKQHNQYNETRNNIRGIKIWKNSMYLAIPKWKAGIPVSLASTSKTPINNITAPLLAPFPNWSMHQVNNCSAFQNVRNLEIDPKGRIWVLDNGSSECPAKLLILDLENDNEILLSYVFPENVVRSGASELTEIALDHEDGGYAYISDSRDPGIVVFSLKKLTSWKIVDDSMRANPAAVGITIEGQTDVLIKTAFNISGLTLSPASTEGNNRTLYYAPLSSRQIFQVPTQALKNPAADFKREVKLLGEKKFQSNSISMSNTGRLYYDMLTFHAIYFWDSKRPSFKDGQEIISRDPHQGQWIDAFAFDQDGKVWCISNRMHLMLDDSFDVAEPNIRALASQTGVFSYQYYENGTAPVLPVILLE